MRSVFERPSFTSPGPMGEVEPTDAPFVQGLNTQAESVEEAFEMAYDAAEALKAVRTKLAKEAAKASRKRAS